MDISMHVPVQLEQPLVGAVAGAGAGCVGATGELGTGLVIKGGSVSARHCIKPPPLSRQVAPLQHELRSSPHPSHRSLQEFAGRAPFGSHIIDGFPLQFSQAS